MASRVEFPQYARAELQRFLTAVDRHLGSAATIVLIGGSAMALRYRVEAVTNDVDTFESDLKEVEKAAKRARAETGLQIELSNATVADLPYEYESRLERILPKLRKLRIFVPERHDLTLSKMVRGQENDFQAVEELHANEPLELDVLVTRYEQEMDHVITDMKRLRLTLLVWVERLFGDQAAQRVRSRLRR